VLAATLQSTVEERRWRLIEQTRALKHLSPAAQLVQARQRVDDLLGRAEETIHHDLTLRRERLNGLMKWLAGISPLKTLERGYAIVRHRETGTVVRSVTQVAAEDALCVRVTDGDFEAKVTSPL
jgi:exodeoxyribonuclease VII large subunit